MSQTKLLEVSGSKARLITFVAKNNDLLSMMSNCVVVPRRSGIAPPFQNITANHYRPRNETILALLFVPANIYDESAGSDLFQCFLRRESIWKQGPCLIQ